MKTSGYFVSFTMSSKTVLILGHSFVRRFKEYLLETEDQRVHGHFNIAQEPVNIDFLGVGGRTVKNIETFDIPVVQNLRPNTIILEVGTNYFTNLKPDVLATKIVSLQGHNITLHIGHRTCRNNINKHNIHTHHRSS